MSENPAASTALTTGTVPVPVAPAPSGVPPTAPVVRRADPAPAPAARIEDIDDRRLREAEEAVRAEESARLAAANGGAPPAPAAEPAQPGVPAAVPPQQRGGGRQPSQAQIAIQSLERIVAQQSEQIAALIAAQQTPPAAAPAAPAPAAPPAPNAARLERHNARDAEITELRALITKAWVDHDNGDNTQVDTLPKAMAYAQALQDRVTYLMLEDTVDILMERIEAAAKPQPAFADRLIIDQQLATLNATHPWLHAMTKQDFAVLEEMAIAEMKARNERLETGMYGLYILRDKIAALADVKGPEWHPEYVLPPGATALVRRDGSGPARSATQPPAASGTPPRAQTPPAALPAAVSPLPRPAVVLPALQPPDPATLGAAASGGGTTLDETAMMAIPFEELGRLPPQRVGARAA